MTKSQKKGIIRDRKRYCPFGQSSLVILKEVTARFVVRAVTSFLQKCVGMELTHRVKTDIICLVKWIDRDDRE